MPCDFEGFESNDVSGECRIAGAAARGGMTQWAEAVFKTGSVKAGKRKFCNFQKKLHF